MNKTFVTLISLTIVVLITGCSSSATQIPCEQDLRCVVYGLANDFDIMDPHSSNSIESAMILRQIYDTLIYRNPVTGEFVPGLAEHWEISPDNLIYTFYLRNDVNFHDGTQFNAQAVTRNIDRIFDPELNSLQSRRLLGPFSRYEVIDDFTLTFHLVEPYVPFLDGLSQVYLGIASPTALEAYSNLRYQFHQIGTGPFQLENYLPGDRVELRRNTGYRWAPSFYQPLNGGEINRIVFKFMTIADQRADALISGQVDIVGELLPSDARTLINNSQVQLHPVNIPGQSVGFYINTQQAPTTELAIRQSLIYATNRVALNDAVFQNFSPVSWAPLTANSPFVHTGFIGEFAYNTGVAGELLETLGYVDSNGDGYLELGEDRLELLMIVPAWGQLPQVAQLIRDQWRSVGIDLIIEPVPGLNSLLARIAAGDYNLVAFDNFGVDPVILATTFESTSPTNLSRYSDEQLDNLMSNATAEFDTRARSSQYYQIQTQIMQQALFLPIRDYVNISATRSNITGLRFDAYGWNPILYNVSKITN